MPGISPSASASPVHWTYAPVDSSTLCQGDIIERTDAVVSLLAEVHPYFAQQDKYLSFMLITQSCDLVRRNGECNARHLTIAGIRTLSDVISAKELPRIASSQAFGREVSMSCRNALLQFLDRLLNNNEPTYFFLRADHSQGIGTDSCACLRVSVPLRVEHYGILLNAKRGQLADVFQAKLGWLVGTNYSRVGTPDWSENLQRLGEFKQLRESITASFNWIEEKRFQQVLALHRTLGRDPTEASVGELKSDPRTEVLRRSALFRRAFDTAWPDAEGIDNSEEHRARAIARTDIAALITRVFDGAWPPGGPAPTRDQLLSTLREHGVPELSQALAQVFDYAWARAPRGPKRSTVLGNLTKLDDFLKATKDP